jgi:hypothetical protein
VVPSNSDRRLEGILRRFFQGDLDHFLTVMHETGTIITGSCALNMLLGNLYDASSSDLNLIVPHKKFFTMDVFPRKLAGYVTAEKTDGSTFFGHRIGRAFRPLSKIACHHFFDESRSDRPDESSRLRYCCCGHDFYDGGRRGHVVPGIHAVRQKRMLRGREAVPREGESNWNMEE